MDQVGISTNHTTLWQGLGWLLHEADISLHHRGNRRRVRGGEAEAQLGRGMGAWRARRRRHQHRQELVLEKIHWSELEATRSGAGTALLLKWGWGQHSSHIMALCPLLSSDKTPVYICLCYKISFYTVLLQILFRIWLITYACTHTQLMSQNQATDLLRHSVPGPYPYHSLNSAMDTSGPYASVKGLLGKSSHPVTKINT